MEKYTNQWMSLQFHYRANDLHIIYTQMKSLPLNFPCVTRLYSNIITSTTCIVFCHTFYEYYIFVCGFLRQRIVVTTPKIKLTTVYWYWCYTRNFKLCMYSMYMKNLKKSFSFKMYYINVYDVMIRLCPCEAYLSINIKT